MNRITAVQQQLLANTRAHINNMMMFITRLLLKSVKYAPDVNDYCKENKTIICSNDK